MRLDITRPLFFLCGPGFKKIEDENKEKDNIKKEKNTNRRFILQSFIANESNKYAQLMPLPVIVDELFTSESEISKYNLNLDMIEEVVSNISAKTYIFLDTMATSYELGLFTNTKQRNNVSILLDNKHKNRSNANVGEYILKAVDPSKVILYDAEYIYNYIYFKDNTLPREIIEDVESTCKELNEQKFVNVEFTEDLSKQYELGRIIYQYSNGKLKFDTDIKTIFYLLSHFFYNKKYVYDLNENIDIVSRLNKLLTLAFIQSNGDKNTLVWDIIANNVIGELTNKDYKIIDVINNICYIIDKFKNGKIVYNDVKISSPYNSAFDVSNNIENEINSIYQNIFMLSKYDMTIINKYNGSNISFVKSFDIIIKGKTRKIYTYNDNKNGKELRKIHEKISKNKFFLNTNVGACAYKENMNTLECIKKHEQSIYFEKYDISNFFESIKIRVLIKMVKSHIVEHIKDYFKDLGRSISIVNNDEKVLRDIILSMTFNRKLIIGFVTSPMWSNYYMKEFDSHFADEDIVYTRYSDDILISSQNYINRKQLDIKVIGELNNLGLIQNDQKRRSYYFNGPNKYIKFLGIVMLRDYNGNVRFKVSQEYRKKVIALIKKHLNDNRDDLYDKIVGSLQYIKYIDTVSYQMIVDLFGKNKIDITKIY